MNEPESLEAMLFKQAEQMLADAKALTTTAGDLYRRAAEVRRIAVTFATRNATATTRTAQ